MAHWIVARTKSRRELWAAENVVKQGFEFYLPRYEIRSRRKGQLDQIKSEALFPGYLFVKTDGSWRVLLSTFGIQAVVLQGDNPAIMPQSEIDRLTGITNQSGLVELPGRFRVGEEVKIRTGPFAEHSGLYQGQTPSGRQKVLMELLGGKVNVLFDASTLEAA